MTRAISGVQTILVIVVLSLGAVGCLPTPMETRSPEDLPPLSTALSTGSIRVQTKQSQYDSLPEEGLMVVFSNGTSRDIRIPTPSGSGLGQGTFRFFKKTPSGWLRLSPHEISVFGPGINTEDSLLVPAGRRVEIEIARVLGGYATPFGGDPPLGTLVAQIRYGWDQVEGSDEFVHYSNEFKFFGPEPVEISKAMVVTESPPFVFSLQNNSDAPFWLPDPCYPDAIGGDDGVLSLQRATDEGSWQVIPPTKDCDQDSEVIRIDPGQTVAVDATKWFEDELGDTDPGVYRWDVVFYLERDEDEDLRDNRHILSETFECGQ